MKPTFPKPFISNQWDKLFHLRIWGSERVHISSNIICFPRAGGMDVTSWDFHEINQNLRINSPSVVKICSGLLIRSWDESDPVKSAFCRATDTLTDSGVCPPQRCCSETVELPYRPIASKLLRENYMGRRLLSPNARDVYSKLWDNW